MQALLKSVFLRSAAELAPGFVDPIAAAGPRWRPVAIDPTGHG